MRFGTAWTIVRGKNRGFHPGFRAIDRSDPTETVYQLEVDPPDHPEMATGAEVVGTAFYHAFGYHTVDVYLAEIDPAALEISPDATIKDANGRRPFVRNDLDEVLKNAARLPNGRIRVSAERLVRGADMGRFEYHGTRDDDPNDIYPHEHRRELRGSRVFAAWLNHDDSRAVNTMVVRHIEQRPRLPAVLHGRLRIAAGQRDTLSQRRAVGSRIHPDRPAVAPDAALVRALRAAVAAAARPAGARRRWAASRPRASIRARGWPSIRRRRSTTCGQTMPSGRRASSRASPTRRFAPSSGKGRYSDPAAAEALADALIKRRDRIKEVWLTGVNPIVNATLVARGRAPLRERGGAARRRRTS